MKTLSFEDLGLSLPLQKAVSEMGFEEPTPIQSLAIPAVRDGRDVIGQAHTGTGKTAAYGIPLLEKVDVAKPAIQALVLCPTRELAIQVSEELRRLAIHLKNMSVIPVYGGQPIERQFAALRKGVQVVIATPGRLLDHLQRGTIRLDQVRMVVLDEADEMLDMGFSDDVEAILRRLPKDRQTVLFSATISPEIRQLAEKYLNQPFPVKVLHEQLTVPGIEQRYLEVGDPMKPEALSRMIDFYNPRLTLVFCNTKRKVDEVVSTLQARGYQAEGLHGDMNQTQRERVMTRVRAGSTDILIATDVAARGIDIEQVELVVNYDVPQDPEYYVHRIGRTGRAGRSGRSITFVSGREVWKLKDIQKFAKIRIMPHPIPTDNQIAEQRAAKLLTRVRAEMDKGGLEPYIPRVEQLMGDDFTSLDVAAALMKIQMAPLGGEPKKEGQEAGKSRPGPSRSQGRYPDSRRKKRNYRS
ncbi:ATP-dependent RNA helicase DeaD [Methanolinea mesophila]|uniref:DEAD/DEAH box helicase n=1 Tax=Methanolinea mesophila TaxID=547055 RepID=UPI001AEB9615|nr:DEAD/DEAH box helicase [Methanolinea mesophila]MBP1928227.1 ATP-dependent RNA helicase DeaD [Methanolinea mesophila]